MKTLSELLGNCRIDEGGHWIYALAPTASRPMVVAPDFTRDPSGKTNTTQGYRRAAWHLKYREPIPAGHKIFSACFVTRCVRPSCLSCMNEVDRGAFITSTGRQKGLITRRVATTLTASLKRKLSDDDVAQIRASKEPIAALAARYCVHKNTILKARAGRSRCVTNFFSGLIK